MKKFLFLFIVVILLAAAGAVFWFWWQAGPSSLTVKTPAPSTSQSFEALPSGETVSSIFEPPAAGQVIKFPVFNYHHIRPMPPASAPIDERSFTVTPEGFEAHLKYFKDNGYQTVLISDLLDYFDTGKPLSAKAVAITFDDGRYGQYDFAYKLLKQYNMVATFFVTTGWVGRKDILTWDEIKEMSDNGMAIGSHSISHPHLTAQNDADLRHELVDSKKEIEEKIGQSINLLAYPGGDYNDRVIKFAKEAGYIAGLGVYKIIDQMPKYRYSIRRFHADDALDSITSKLVNY